MSNWKPRQSDIDWTRKHFDSLNDGTVWGIPRNNSIWRIDKIARVLTCIHGPKDEMFNALTTTCKILGYTTRHATETLEPEVIAKHLPITLDESTYGTGKSIVHTDKAPKKKYLWREITDSDRAAILVNLAQLPEAMRWNGSTTPQCDFCSDSKPIVTYGASRMTTGEVKDCWRWLACAECHAAITRNDFIALEDRAVKKIIGTIGHNHSRKTLQFAIKMALLRFHKEVTQL